MTPVSELFYVNVPGPLATQGSKRIGRNRATGKPIVLDANDTKLREYRNRIVFHSAAVRTASQWRDDSVAFPLNWPLEIAIVFAIDRPKSHLGTGRNAAKLHPAAPDKPAVKPDIDKLERAVLDSLTIAGIIRDDCIITSTRSHKIYAPTGQEGFTRIRLYTDTYNPLGDI